MKEKERYSSGTSINFEIHEVEYDLWDGDKLITINTQDFIEKKC